MKSIIIYAGLSIAFQFAAMAACGGTLPPAVAHVALAKSCEKEQTLIVEKAEVECVDPVCVAACDDDEDCKCSDKVCVAAARLALDASNLACEAGLAELQAEIDALATEEAATDG